MKLVSFGQPESWQPGLLVAGDRVVSASSAAAAAGWDGHDDGELLRSILGAAPDRRRGLREAAESLATQEAPGVHDLSAVVLGPPVPRPDKILCVGLNYRDHASEVALDESAVPTLFAKFRNSLIGPGAPIVLPAISSEVDFEGEMALVIGRRCKDVPVADALDCVAGYMPFNDVSARDVQMQASQWTAGKAIDGFGPCGPALVFAEDVRDPTNLDIATRLNGETMQAANTAQMLFGIAELVTYISSVMTLEPGDIVATGTPAGVGYTREPPVFLQDGDVVEVEVEGLGVLTSPVAGARRNLSMPVGTSSDVVD